MTDRPTKVIVCCCGNCEAEGHAKESIVELTDTEIAEAQVAAAQAEADRIAAQAEADAKEAAKAAAHAKLVALGLTPEEIAALA